MDTTSVSPDPVRTGGRDGCGRPWTTSRGLKVNPTLVIRLNVPEVDGRLSLKVSSSPGPDVRPTRYRSGR